MKKTNLWNKAISLATALVLVAGLVIGTGLSASAADNGSITVHKYARPTAGVPHESMYTGEPIADTSSLGKPLEGAGFTLYKLNTEELNQEIASGYKFVSYEIDNDNINNNVVTFNLAGQGKTPPTKAVTAAPSPVGGEQFTNSNGIIQFSGLADAYYLLVETTVPSGYVGSAKSIIRLPLTLSDGSAHNREIHVYPKNVSNTSPVRKEIVGGAKMLQDNEQVSFKITADFRNEKTGVANISDMKNGALYGEAFVIDEIQKYFKFISVGSVTLLDAAGNEIATLVSGVDYQVDVSKLNAALNGNLIVRLTNGGIDKAVAAKAASYVVNITLQYLGAEAFDEMVVPELKNVAKSVVTKAGSPPVDPEDPEIPDIPQTTVYFPTTQIVLNKKDSDGKPFAGAVFRLSKKAVPTSEDDYVRNINGQIIELETQANGLLVFNGVGYNELTGTTYYLQEMSTVGGYQLKVGTIAVSFLPKSQITDNKLVDNGNWLEKAVYSVSTTVVNYKLDEIDPDEPAFALPLTGGAGTTILTIVGVLTMLGAVVWFVRRKKESV